MYRLIKEFYMFTCTLRFIFHFLSIPKLQNLKLAAILIIELKISINNQLGLTKNTPTSVIIKLFEPYIIKRNINIFITEVFLKKLKQFKFIFVHRKTPNQNLDPKVGPFHFYLEFEISPSHQRDVTIIFNLFCELNFIAFPQKHFSRI